MLLNCFKATYIRVINLVLSHITKIYNKIKYYNQIYGIKKGGLLATYLVNLHSLWEKNILLKIRLPSVKHHNILHMQHNIFLFGVMFTMWRALYICKQFILSNISISIKEIKSLTLSSTGIRYYHINTFGKWRKKVEYLIKFP